MDPWRQLRNLTSARIALGRSGGSLPTRERLDFQLAHARARDAVLAPFDPAAYAAQLASLELPVLPVHSAAADRAEFLRRPDLGRQLAPASRALLEAAAAQLPAFDLAIILSDGLSTHAVNTQAQPLLAALLPMLAASRWSVAPIVIARHGRVALQDEIGAILKATLSIMLIGERPGLGSADSLGIYFTFAPTPGRTDADRNCISNIRDGGLSIPAAAAKLRHLLRESLRLQLSGVQLKDDSPLPVIPGWASKTLL